MSPAVFVGGVCAQRLDVRRARNILRVATWLGYAATFHFAAHAIGAALVLYVLDIPAFGVISEPEARSQPGIPRSPGIGATDPRASSREQAAAAILGHDVFCPDCVEAPAPSAAAPPPARFAPYGEGATLDSLLHPGEPATTLPLDLVATMEAEGPGRSLATIAHESRGVGVFVRGDEILPGVELLRVGHGVVHLRNHDTVEYLALQPPQEQRAPPQKKPKKEAKKKPSKYAIEGADEAIECSKDHRCKIDRAFVETLVRKPALLARQGRMRPYQRSGQMTGFRLSGARRGTLPRLLGLRSGDIVREINGQALTSMDTAFGLLTKLRHASHLDITVSRKGKTLTMSLDIV